MHIPEEKIIAPGDLFIWAVPNGGNPQKIQRYISDWAEALDEMIALEPEILLPGHGFPIYGKERIQEALSTTSMFLKTIETQTVELMNKGKRLNEIIHTVIIPDELIKLPWLRPVYDDPEFLIRMIWRRYGGWWDGEYDRLLPAKRNEEAKVWIDLVGGIELVIDKALKMSSQGKDKIAAHLIETAFYADETNENVHKARKAIYENFSIKQDSSMARNILNHASLASGQNKRDLAEKN